MWCDRFGLLPTPVEAATMAGHIYGDYDMGTNGKSSRTVEGWRLIDVLYGRESMKMGIYIKNTDDWQNPSEYTVVFRGSIIELSWESFDVWKNNIEQAISGKSADMWDAINCAKGFVKNKGNTEITFVGHSKGGAEAAGAAVATSKNAILFNPAKLNVAGYGLDGQSYSANMTQYVMQDEVLSTLKFGPVSKKAIPSITTTDLIKPNTGLTVFEQIYNHLIGPVKKAIVEGRYVG